MNRQLCKVYCCFLVPAILLAGCGESQPSLADYNNNNMKKLRGAYGLFLVSHNLRGPKDEEELKEFLTTSPDAIRKMERQGVPKDKILDIFVNERDGQPFKVKYGLNGLGDYPIVFEETGVDGKRFVAYTTPKELNNDEYEKAWDSKVRISLSGAADTAKGELEN